MKLKQFFCKHYFVFYKFWHQKTDKWSILKVCIKCQKRKYIAENVPMEHIPLEYERRAMRKLSKVISDKNHA